MQFIKTAKYFKYLLLKHKQFNAKSSKKLNKLQIKKSKKDFLHIKNLYKFAFVIFSNATQLVFFTTNDTLKIIINTKHTSSNIKKILYLLIQSFIFSTILLKFLQIKICILNNMHTKLFSFFYLRKRQFSILIYSINFNPHLSNKQISMRNHRKILQAKAK